VSSLENRIKELEQQLVEMSDMDARTQEELNAGEPEQSAIRANVKSEGR
jgi:hypothetical protein